MYVLGYVPGAIDCDCSASNDVISAGYRFREVGSPPVL